MEKTCTTCKVTYPATLEYFGREKTGKFGLRSKCKSCRSEERKKYLEENKEKENERSRKYRQENPERMKQLKRDWYIRRMNNDEFKENRKFNSNKYKENRKKYYQKNKEKIKEYYQENQSEIKEKVKKYQKTARGREVGKISENKRRLKIKELPCDFTEQNWTACKDFFENRCAYCGSSEKLEQDHFIPVSKNGEYAKSNIIPSCRSCNSSKHDDDFFEWYPKRVFYSEKRKQKILKYLNYNKNQTQQLTLL